MVNLTDYKSNTMAIDLANKAARDLIYALGRTANLMLPDEAGTVFVTIAGFCGGFCAIARTLHHTTDMSYEAAIDALLVALKENARLSGPGKFDGERIESASAPRAD